MTRKLLDKEYVVHIDGDAFFVSCEIARMPHLAGKPVVVGRERGIVMAMNSHAKALGVVRAMPIHQIIKEMPQVVILGSHFELYKSFSQRIVSITKKYCQDVEVYSIDEVFCVYLSSGDIVEEIKKIQKEIYDTLGITCSAGISKNKVLAKLATNINKPEGTTLISETNREEILSRTNINDIWGIGKRTTESLQKKGIKTALDFVTIGETFIAKEHLPVRELYLSLLGNHDMAKAGLEEELQKSFQSTESFPRTNERTFLFSEISRHIEIVCSRLYKSKQKTKSISIFLKDINLNYYSTEVKISDYTDNSGIIISRISEALPDIYNDQKYYKSSGVTVSGLSSAQKGPVSLFEEIEVPERDVSTEALKSSLRAKFGARALYLGSSFVSNNRKEKKASELQKTDSYIYKLPLPYLGEAR